MFEYRKHLTGHLPSQRILNQWQRSIEPRMGLQSIGRLDCSSNDDYTEKSASGPFRLYDTTLAVFPAKIEVLKYLEAQAQ